MYPPRLAIGSLKFMSKTTSDTPTHQHNQPVPSSIGRPTSSPDQEVPEEAHDLSPLILVTGAGGFLGSEIARQGLARGLRVRGLARGHYPEMQAIGVEMLRGDVANADVVREAARDCIAIFHVAAKAGAWGPTADYERANVQGTREVIEACRLAQVPKLIFTSSPSVVHAGGDIEGADESLPYPDHYLADYPRTKAEAEQLALAANGPDLSTVALRPHLIWGPGDRHLIPRLVDRARRGRLRHLAPEKLVDSVYIEDAARAHWDAFDQLRVGADCAGKAYFITQGEPWPIAELIEGILDALNESCPRRTISPKLAMMIGRSLEWIYRLLKIHSEPVMTRFIAEQLSTAHWFSIEAARRDLGYQPQRTIREALIALREAESAGKRVSD